MDFSGLAGSVARLGLPLIGRALGGPAGGVVANMISGALGLETDDPSEISRVIVSDPAAAERLRAMEIEKAAELDRFVKEAEAKALAEVNATMRAEAGSEHFLTRTWRPVWGYVSAFAFGLAIVGLIIFLFVIAWTGAWEALTALPTFVNSLVILFGIPGAVLGITTWHRGKMQRIRAGELPTQGRGVGAMLRGLSGRDDVPGQNGGNS